MNGFYWYFYCRAYGWVGYRVFPGTGGGLVLLLLYSVWSSQGRFLIELWQGHGPGKFLGRSANFSHFDRNFLYILVSVSFGPGTFNEEDPSLGPMGAPKVLEIDFVGS
ncbi:hypothetical protein Hanom_Chr04g00335101 [Helianthus anomalus]